VALPKQLKFFNIFVNGGNYAGIAESITLPKLSRKLESHRAAGMPGAVKIDLGFDDDALDFEFTVAGIAPEITELVGGSINSCALRFAGAFQQEDQDAYLKVEISLTGRLKEVDLGEIKQGEKQTSKYQVACTYYRLELNNATVVEIDLLHMVHKTSNKNLLEQARQSIGL